MQISEIVTFSNLHDFPPFYVTVTFYFYRYENIPISIKHGLGSSIKTHCVMTKLLTMQFIVILCSVSVRKAASSAKFSWSVLRVQD
jgi:hypothetical protein